MTTQIELGPWAKRRHALLTSGGPPPDDVTTPREDVPGATHPVELPTDADAMSAATRDELDAFATQVASTALVVLRGGAVVHEWYAPGTDRDTRRPSQSMHKTVLGIVTLRCVEEGLVPGLDTSASTWLREWADDERAAITIDDLLHMTSGLAQHGMSMDPTTPAFHWLFGDDTTPHVLGFPAVHPPGESFDYNNLNSQALGVLLERATGERYAALLDRLLWAPLGAATAEVWLDSPGGQAATSCCLEARALDWALIGELIRTRGTIAGHEVTAPDLVDALCTPSPADPQYARQIWLGDGMDLAGGSSGGLSPVGRFTAAEDFVERGVVVACGFGGQRVYVARESGVVLVRIGPPTGTPRFQQHWDNTRLLNTAIRGVGQ